MNPRWRHILRRTWFTAGGVLAVLVILLAVLMALGQLLLPLAAHYPDRVAAAISQRVDRPVSFESMQGYWQPSGPLLVLHHVEIGRRNGKPALVLPSAKVKLDFGALVMPSRHWVNLRLSGLKLSLERDDNGQWHVAGFGVAGKGQSHQLTLSDLPGNLWLDDLELDIDDAETGHHYRVHVGPLRLSNSSNELRFAGLLRRGESSQALKVAGRVRDGGKSGRLYLAADAADLGAMFSEAGAGGYAVKSGRGDVALWATWNDRRLTGMTADVDLENLVLVSPDGTIKAPQLRGLAQYRRDGDKATMLFAPGTSGAARVDITGMDKNMRMVARAKNFDPGSWLKLVALAPQLPASLGQWLIAAAPTVHVASAYVDFSHAQGIHDLSVHFDHLGLAAAGKRPGVDHVHGVLRGDGEAVSLELPAQPLTIDFPHMFRKPLAFTSVDGNLAVWKNADDDWHLGIGGIAFKTKGMNGRFRGSVRLPAGGGSPYLNVYASVDDTDVLAAERFLPVGIMSPHTVKWLDHGLIGGSLDDAQVVLHGDMSDWPFTDHQGRFEAHADISDLALHYKTDWPGAKDISVSVDFVDNGMMAIATKGDVHGIKVTRAVANIADFGKAELVLNAQGHGKGADMMDFVRKSPLGKPHEDVLGKLKMGGQADFNFSMVVPLSSRAPDPLTLGGTVRLHNADVDAPAWKLHMDALNGELAFDTHGFSTRGLTATFHGQPVTLDMSMGPQTGHVNWPLKVRMRGSFSLAQLAQGRERLSMLSKLSSGTAPFDIGFHLDSKAANAMHAHQVLTVSSNLRGIQLKLPAPLAKPKQALWPLNVKLGLPFSGGHMRVILGNRLYARARLPSKQQPMAVDVRLGGQAPSGPMPSGIRIRGRAPNLDVSGWVSKAIAAVGDTSGGKMPQIDVDVTADHTHVFGQKFNKLRIKFHPTSTSLKLAVGGPNIKGTVTVPIHDIDKRGIVARFDRLYWPKPKQSGPKKSGKTKAPAPKPASLISSAPLPKEAADVGVAPSTLPPLHVWVGDLRFGDAHLGHARLETWPTTKGMHIDMLRAQSKSMHMSASGDWNGTATNSHTHFEMNFSAANLGHMLDAFGYNGIFIGGETHAHLDATWPGAPSSFALANVEGTLSVKIGRGRIPKVKPGVGRLFGLMSIAELPRRLTMDFGSIFGKGMGFDSITGHFRFHDGSAYTKDFVVKGPAVDIHVSGRVGFRKRVYDQYVLAIPHVGNSLPIVGAIVGGPVGAAAGLVVQGLLGKGLNKAASARYHLTGPWDNPKITVMEKHVPKSMRAPAASTSAALPARAASIRRVARPAPATSTH